MLGNSFSPDICLILLKCLAKLIIKISQQCQPLQFFVLSPPTILTDGSEGIKTRLIIEIEERERERELICWIKIKFYKNINSNTSSPHNIPSYNPSPVR